MSSLQPTRLPEHLATFPPPAKQATSAYEIKNLYKPASSSSLASPLSRPNFTQSLSFPTPPSSSDANHSPPSSPETDAHPSRQGSDSSSTEEDEEADSVPAPLPIRTVRCRGIQERQREKATGKKSTSLIANMARKRAEADREAAWAKYSTMSPITIELNMSNDEIARRA